MENIGKMTAVEEVKSHYKRHFDPVGYRILCLEEQYIPEELFFLKSMTDVFEKHNLRGSSLLDIGSGPSIPNIAPACKRFSHIVLSDLVDANRKELNKWLSGSNDALDYSKILQACALFQGYRDPKLGEMDIETNVRRNVKHVIPCDVLSDQIVPEKFAMEYDAVQTCRTLESACENYALFMKSLKNINSLVKKGGHLIMTGYIDGGFWIVSNKKFPYLTLSIEDICFALKEAGFSQIDCKFSPDSKDYIKVCYCLSCIKSEEIK